MRQLRLTHSAAVGLALAALVAPTAVAQDDLRSPDARDAARAVQSRPLQPSIDLRAPDTRDAAAGRGTFSAPDVTVVRVSDPARRDGGLDWVDTGIGAGGMLGLVLVAAGGALLVTRRRHDRPAAHQPAITG
jgi:hypothetical protein